MFKLIRILMLLLLIVKLATLQAQITPWEATKQMQKGINLGNTMEPPKEAGWNNPRAEEYYFDLYKEAGFKLVRIPVRWDNYTGKTFPFKIDEAWLNRVETVVDWGLRRDLFVVLNSHHDNWIKEEYTDINKARFDSIWSQIAVRFKDKSEKLFFEVLNEPKGLSKAQNDEMHARILSIIRKTNPTRIVVLQGNEWGGLDQLIQMAIPKDSFIIGSFHSYDPFQFTHYDEEIGQITWGTAGDIAKIDNSFKRAKQWSDQTGIPVFLGEFGAQKKSDYNSRMRHYRTYVTLAEKYGFAHAAWDDGGNFRILERELRYWDEVKDILQFTTDNAPWPIVDVLQDSIIRVRWNNRVSSHDSLIVQRRLATKRDYQTIAVMKPDTNQFFDVKPTMDRFYSYRIIASYTDSVQLYSHPFRIFFPAWERKVKEPFRDSLFAIPGVVEAEDFDKGGEGLSYHDADKINITGEYRPNEGVDIYDRLGNGYHIGNMITGEWLEYSVRVKSEGWYDVTFYVASLLGGGTFELTIDSVSSGPVDVLASYHPLNTKPVTIKMYLFEGEFIMRFTVLEGAQYNLDKIVFDLTTSAILNEQQSVLSVFQNNMGQLVIRQNENNSFKTISVFTVSGTLLKTFYEPEKLETVNSGFFNPGVYLIQAKTKNKIITKKIILH